MSMPLLMVVTSWLSSYICEFRNVRSVELHSDRNADCLRCGGLSRDLHHYGDVRTV